VCASHICAQSDLCLRTHMLQACTHILHTCPTYLCAAARVLQLEIFVRDGCMRTLVLLSSGE